MWSSLDQTEGAGMALVNYMHKMNNEEFDDEVLDLEPSAEDLEIFAELEQEQIERQARIDRGEPAVDPMVRIEYKIFVKCTNLITHNLKQRYKELTIS